MRRSQLKSYLASHYIAPKMVLAGAGGVPHEQLVELGKKYFGHMDGSMQHTIEDEIAEQHVRFHGVQVVFNQFLGKCEIF